MNYNEAMEYIKDTQRFGSNYGLKRTFKILEILGNPHQKIKIIHVAGTNGKGSTTSIITSILMESGYNVGMYTSPFLEEFEERIQINKKNIEKDKLAYVVTKVKEATDSVIEQGYEKPTEFEIITCAMFLHFYLEKVDFAVVEVGLGGRLDATNVAEPILSVIASISYDHMNILGSTLGEIAYEKCGIIKNNIPCITYPQEEEVLEVIKKVSKEKDSKLYILNKSEVELINPREDNFTQKIKIKKDNNYNQNTDLELKLKLLGYHQTLNALLAIRSVQILKSVIKNITNESIINGAAKATWIGRMEVLKNEPLIVIDGAHNADGIKKLKESINTYFEFEKIILVIGVLGDKEVKKMLDIITKDVENVIVLSPHNERALDPSSTIKLLNNKEIDAYSYNDYKEGISRALDIANKDDIILICGSLYMIGDMRKVIKNNYK